MKYWPFWNISGEYESDQVKIAELRLASLTCHWNNFTESDSLIWEHAKKSVGYFIAGDTKSLGYAAT